MTEREIYDGVILGGTADFALVIETLRRHRARWCVVDGWAANTYAAPVYTADLDLVVLAADLEPTLADLRAADFCVEEFPSCTKAQRRLGPTEQAKHKLTVRFMKLDCHQPFIQRAAPRPIFGLDVPVAALSDVVRGKLWMWTDSGRRPSKKLKDQFDLLRLAEARFDEVVPLLPAKLRVKVEADRQRHLETGESGWGDED